MTIRIDADNCFDAVAPFSFTDGSIDLVDLAERMEFIAPKVGRLRGDRIVRVDPSDPIAVAKARAAVKDRNAARAPDLESKISLIALIRIHELERYLEHRNGRIVPDYDAGREDLLILLNHVAQNRNSPRDKTLGFIWRWAPWMAPTEAEAIIAMILKKPRKYRPETLGRLLRLTEQERDTLEITTIRAFDATDESMEGKVEAEGPQQERSQPPASRRRFP